jgi:hypothetical protein
VLPWEKAGSSSVERKAAEWRAKSVRSLAWATVAILILAGVSWWLIFQFGKGPKQVANPPIHTRPPTARSAEDKSIAVLPFTNMSADKADEYLSDGISEEIITALSKIKGLKVPAHVLFRVQSEERGHPKDRPATPRRHGARRHCHQSG